jgi:hypothetical protein
MEAVSVSSSSERPSAFELVEALKAGKVLESTPGGMSIRDLKPTPDPGDTTVAEPALDESGYPWLHVEALSDAEDDLRIGFSDPFVADHDSDIDRCVEFVLSLPGVDSAFRQDPEEIFVVGTRDARRIQDSLVTWFGEVE